jgi:hypothetical protein
VLAVNQAEGSPFPTAPSKLYWLYGVECEGVDGVYEPVPDTEREGVERGGVDGTLAMAWSRLSGGLVSDRLVEGGISISVSRA